MGEAEFPACAGKATWLLLHSASYRVNRKQVTLSTLFTPKRAMVYSIILTDIQPLIYVLSVYYNK